MTNPPYVDSFMDDVKALVLRYELDDSFAVFALDQLVGYYYARLAERVTRLTREGTDNG